jgi:formylmethanofuran dehydrogenase subunit A
MTLDMPGTMGGAKIIFKNTIILNYPQIINFYIQNSYKLSSHEELKKMAGKAGKGAKHEFELSNGRIVTRKVAAKVAEKAGEVPKSVGKKLHSHDLRNALGIKKKKM